MDTSTLDNLNFRLTLGDVKKMTVAEREVLARECQTNLRFLVNCVLRPASRRFLSLNERTHGPIFDGFVRPDPGKPFDEWSPIKERVTLAFRGALKSTIVGGFLTQVLLCDPDIRMLILSGKLPHAKTIMISGRQPFTSNEVIRYLFPDWAVEPEDVGGDYFICPRRDPTLNLRDPSFAIGTFDSVKAGGHYELIILDDCTNEINCLDGGSRITTMSGFHAVEDVMPGLILPTGIVTRQWKTSSYAPVSRLTLSDGRSLRLTKNHLVKVSKPYGGQLAKDGSWRRRKFNDTWVSAGDLKPGDCVPFPLGGGFPQHENERADLALISGLIWGDGSGRKHPRYSTMQFVLFVPEHDASHLGVIENVFRWDKKSNIKGGSRVCFNAAKARELFNWGLDKFGRDRERGLPEKVIFCATKNEVCAFLRGWFDADGCVDDWSGGRVSLTSVSLAALRDAQLLLQKLGIESRIYLSKGSFKAFGKEWGHSPSLRITHSDNINLFSALVGFSNPRKVKALESISGRKAIRKRRLLGKVISVRDDGFSSVYDVTVAGSHEFVAEGIPVHNCATPELVAKNEEHYDDTEGLLEPGGYRPFFGTRWAPDDNDLPEVIRLRGEAYELEHLGERNTSYTAVPVWTLRRGATPREDEELQARDRTGKLHPEDVILTWPEKLSAKVLWPKYRANPRKFNGQYLLRWRGSFLAESFPPELLLANTRPFAEGMPLPHDRFMVVNWDMGGVYTGRRPKQGFDFSFGFAGMFELSTRRLFLYDAFMEVFSSSTDAATAIVQFFARQLKVGPVGVCRIEDSLGIRMLEGEINAIAKQLGVPIQIYWDAPDNHAGAKDIGISMLAGAMKRGLVQFATNIPHRDQFFKQFEAWSPQKSTRRKDDGPDCAAQIWRRYNGEIFPNMVATLQPSGFSFEPEMPEEVDPHADERENADFAVLERMTVPHA